MLCLPNTINSSYFSFFPNPIICVFLLKNLVTVWEIRTLGRNRVFRAVVQYVIKLWICPRSAGEKEK